MDSTKVIVDASNGKLAAGITSHYCMVGDVRTHYLEAGAEHGYNKDIVIMLHSAEFGARAVYSFLWNMNEIGKHFHVFAPDMIGFGETDKVHDFVKNWDNRVTHIHDFCETLCIPEAHFIGSSFSGGLIQRVALMDPCPWPILSIISISGGGAFPDSPARRVLLGYDGTEPWMKKLLQMLCNDEKWWTDEIVKKKWEASIEPGAWEALSAPRFTRPGLEREVAPPPPDVSKITQPTFITAGDLDELRVPNAKEELHAAIPGSEFKMFSPSKHNPHFECADEWNELAIDFLLRNRKNK